MIGWYRLVSCKIESKERPGPSTFYEHLQVQVHRMTLVQSFDVPKVSILWGLGTILFLGVAGMLFCCFFNYFKKYIYNFFFTSKEYNE